MTFMLIVIAVTLLLLVVVAVSILGALGRIAAAVATTAAAHLAYLKHSEDENLQAEYVTLQLAHLVRSGAIKVAEKPEGEVESDA